MFTLETQQTRLFLDLDLTTPDLPLALHVEFLIPLPNVRR